MWTLFFFVARMNNACGCHVAHTAEHSMKCVLFVCQHPRHATLHRHTPL